MDFLSHSPLLQQYNLNLPITVLSLLRRKWKNNYEQKNAKKSHFEKSLNVTLTNNIQIAQAILPRKQFFWVMNTKRCIWQQVQDKSIASSFQSHPFLKRTANLKKLMTSNNCFIFLVLRVLKSFREIWQIWYFVAQTYSAIRCTLSLEPISIENSAPYNPKNAAFGGYLSFPCSVHEFLHEL